MEKNLHITKPRYSHQMCQSLGSRYIATQIWVVINCEQSLIFLCKVTTRKTAINEVCNRTG